MNPIDQLLPPISPAPVGLWPLAPGWWVLALLIIALMYGLWRRARRPKPTPAVVIKTAPALTSDALLEAKRVSALAELAALAKPYDAPAGLWLQQLNGLLKRLCRNDYPTANSHLLSGRQWLAFLDNRCPAAGLTRWMILVEGAYKPECTLDDKSINGLHQAIETWVRKHV